MNDLAALETAFGRRAGRWPREIGGPLQVAVAASVPEAHAIAERLGLPGDPRVPRTHPDRRIALIPLPRDDALVLERPEPPRTWRETFRHEAAHLLSLERPDLLTAPLWFQEGLAESFTRFPGEVTPAGSAARTATAELAVRLAGEAGSEPLLPRLAEMPGEARLAAWRLLAEEALRTARAGDRAPWSSVEALTAAELRASFPAETAAGALFFRGREASPPAGELPLLLASYPGETVAARLLPAWDGRVPLELIAEVGRTGVPEAGLILAGGDRRLRLRIGRHGELGAHLEDYRRVEARPLRASPEDPGRLRSRLALRIALEGGGVRVDAGSRHFEFPLEPGRFEPPFAVELYVRDGALAAELDPAAFSGLGR